MKESIINVTKSYLPSKKKYNYYLEKIWDNGQLTNQGSLLDEFEHEASSYLKIKKDNFQFVANGTLALQLALRSLELKQGEVITTPFSYVATTSAIMWEGFTPKYADIDQDSLTLDPKKIENAINKNTRAIIPVHVYGNPCDVDAIEKISKKYRIPVIYDASHCFGVEYQGKSLLGYGDISTCSFHATKLLHTIEGGCTVSSKKEINSKIELMKRFGHNGDDYLCLGINAKSSEFNAAMGLCNLADFKKILNNRETITKKYDDHLGQNIIKQKIRNDVKYNYSYYPVIFKTENDLLKKLKELNNQKVYPRRYFYPSLNTLPYVKKSSCPVSEDISNRILCLPLFYGMRLKDVDKICEIINK